MAAAALVARHLLPPALPRTAPGEYLFTVVLTLRLDGLPPKTVRVESNVFTIHEAEG